MSSGISVSIGLSPATAAYQHSFSARTSQTDLNRNLFHRHRPQESRLDSRLLFGRACRKRIRHIGGLQLLLMTDQNENNGNAYVEETTTLRWCSNFVAGLELCPWAKLCLLTQNAIRIKIVPQRLGLQYFEEAIRECAVELLQRTGHEDYCSNFGDNVEYIDPNVGITFIVAVPDNNSSSVDTGESGRSGQDFGFQSFSKFAFDLEDRLFDEADDAVEEAERTNSNILTPIGDAVTVAPFHPDWQFGQDDDGLAWEKRTPFPTVSLVRSSAIDAAGEEATARIASHNEATLKKLGSHALQQLYQKSVLQNKEDRN